MSSASMVILANSVMNSFLLAIPHLCLDIHIFPTLPDIPNKHINFGPLVLVQLSVLLFVEGIELDNLHLCCNLNKLILSSFGEHALNYILKYQHYIKYSESASDIRWMKRDKYYLDYTY